MNSNENCGNSNIPTVPSLNLCNIPEEERLSYVMASLKDSIQNSNLPEVIL